MMWIRAVVLVACAASLMSCSRGEVRGEGAATRAPWDALVNRRSALVQARSGFKTKLREVKEHREPVDQPPPELLRLVSYPTAIGPMRAYVSPPPGDGRRYPIMIWRFGGLSNGIGDLVWKPAPETNDQSASQYMREGLLMMYPSVRGAHDNPGHPEGFLGEVDDMRAAIAYARSLPYVDPEHVYLGGHSTGATLALLTAATLPAGVVRQVIALGPTDDISGYGQDIMPFDMSHEAERRLRSPVRWLADVRTETLIVEGEHGNADSARALEAVNNPLVSVSIVDKADHFLYVGPVNRVLAIGIRDEAAGKAPPNADDRTIEQFEALTR